MPTDIAKEQYKHTDTHKKRSRKREKKKEKIYKMESEHVSKFHFFTLVYFLAVALNFSIRFLSKESTNKSLWEDYGQILNAILKNIDALLCCSLYICLTI